MLSLYCLIETCLIQDGNTALHYICSANNYDCFQLLLSNGADTGLKNKAGQTAADKIPSFDERRDELLQLINSKQNPTQGIITKECFNKLLLKGIA